MDRLYGAISADVVDSTSLSAEDMFHLGNEIRYCFTDIKRYLYSDFWGRVVKGDTVECCLDHPEMALRLALLIKCRVKAWVGGLKCSDALKDHGVRFSIGVGGMRIIDSTVDIMDGEAIYRAGRNLNRISGSIMTSSFDMNMRDKNIAILINMCISLLDDLINSLSAKQSIVMYYRMLGMTEMEISNILSISQPSVNTRSRNGGWKLINDTLNVFEQINYKDYVV